MRRSLYVARKVYLQGLPEQVARSMASHTPAQYLNSSSCQETMLRKARCSMIVFCAADLVAAVRMTQVKLDRRLGRQTPLLFRQNMHHFLARDAFRGSRCLWLQKLPTCLGYRVDYLEVSYTRPSEVDKLTRATSLIYESITRFRRFRSAGFCQSSSTPKLRETCTILVLILVDQWKEILP